MGRADWIRRGGRSYRQLESEGWLLPVVEAHLRYLQPARYDDLLDIEAGPEDLRAASVRFSYRLLRSSDGELLCEGYTLHACLGSDGKVRRFSDELLAMLHPHP